MTKLILKNHQAPGDVLMLSAAVRDLHRAFPGEYLIDTRTPCPAIFENNPNVTPLQETDPEVRLIRCEYPLIHRSNTSPYHFIHGYIQFLSEVLKKSIPVTDFKGDIHISQKEKSWIGQIEEITGANVPFWIIMAGGEK